MPNSLINLPPFYCILWILERVNGSHLELEI